MKVLIIGGEGNMGRRYSCILKHLKHEVIISDIDDKDRNKKISKAEYIIVATPTDRHVVDLMEIYQQRVDKLTYILCEKPIDTSTVDVKATCALYNKDNNLNLYMVNNYNHIPIIKRDTKIKPNSLYKNLNITKYCYFNSGNDGLYYDCIQLIYLARNKVILSNDSPFYLCMINGYTIERLDIDISYIDMLDDFLHNREHMWGVDDILKAHKKVEELKWK